TVSASQTGQQPSPGLDAARHAAMQSAASQAESLRTAFFPSCMATALQFTGFGAAAYQTMLDQALKEAGSPDDPIAVMLAQQLVFVHLRMAQLQASAAEAKSTEAIKILNAAAARLLGEFRRTALVLRFYRQPIRGAQAEKAPAVLKIAR